jgi:hypothetical protein
MSATEPFKRAEALDEEGIVGARWWHEGLAHSDPLGRRSALKALLVGAGVLATGALLVKACSPEKTKTERQSALDAQKRFGWDLGARAESLTFDGQTTAPFQPSLLATLEAALLPTRADLRPYFVRTLVQSSNALPQTNLPDDLALGPFTPVSGVLRPIFTMRMDAAFRRGKALAALFDGKDIGAAVVVDLPGPESVAFAAGAASVFDPVFAIDNWPHPRGVVPAHLTLAAAAYYQPLFAKAGGTRSGAAPAMFVLDRARLTPYTDENSQFDNRHLAKLPSFAKLKELGVRRILYVVPTFSDIPELDDLNDDFVHDQGAGIVVKIVSASAFGPVNADAVAALRAVPAPDGPASQVLAGMAASMPDVPYHYALSPAGDSSFWVDYPWLDAPPPGAQSSVVPTGGRDYVPTPRTTTFSTPSAMGMSNRTTPAGFGMVPILVGVTSGTFLGAAAARSGSWNRSSGGWGG